MCSSFFLIFHRHVPTCWRILRGLARHRCFRFTALIDNYTLLNHVHDRLTDVISRSASRRPQRGSRHPPVNNEAPRPQDHLLNVANNGGD